MYQDYTCIMRLKINLRFFLRLDQIAVAIFYSVTVYVTEIILDLLVFCELM